MHRLPQHPLTHDWRARRAPASSAGATAPQLPRGTGRRLRGAASALACTLAFTGPAGAHHAPGHGASEGIRTVNTFTAGSARATQRAMLLTEVVRSTDEPTLNPSTVLTTSALVSVAPHPWFSVGVQAPLTIVREDAPEAPTKVGYGDTRFELRLTPHADKLTHRVLTLGLNVSLPTRTVEFEVDPGAMTSVTPLVVFNRRYADWSWYALLLAPIEHRPAGTAFDAGAGLGGGYRALTWLDLSVGLLSDIRVATSCTTASGSSEWCSDGRVTERNRDPGSLRAYTTAGAGFSMSDRWTLTLGAQLPVTPRADFVFAGSAGLEARF